MKSDALDMMSFFYKYNAALAVVLSAPLITAQVPYEFFEIKSIDPPVTEGKLRSSVQKIPPRQITLDDNTKTAGDLSLSEPFTPPAGTYKRMMVLSRIVEKDVDGQKELVLVPDDSGCRPAEIRPAPASHSLHRSAVVHIQTDPEHGTDIPGDSADMMLTSFNIMPIADDNSPLPNLKRCADGRYVIFGNTRGFYRLEYETASYPDSAAPRDASFFADAEADENVHIDISAEKRLMRVLSASDTYRQLDPAHLDRLIDFFQKFESAPLTPQAGTGVRGDALILKLLAEKKGLCRHRVFLFVLISSLWNYRTRMVINEVHAFAEIYHRGRWYPVELGGRANSLTVTPTNGSAVSEIRRNYSFLEDADEQQYGRGEDGQERGQPGIPGVSERHPEIKMEPAVIRKIAFDPEIGFPYRIDRRNAFEISGRMKFEGGETIAGGHFEIVFESTGGRTCRQKFTTGAGGTFKLEVRLPADWPVGMTSASWRKLP